MKFRVANLTQSRWWFLPVACSAMLLPVMASAQCKLDTLVASDGQSGDNFGLDVATEGDAVIVGAWQHNHQDAGSFSGAAYVFERNGSAWAQSQELLASNPNGFDNFGQAVAMSGDWAMISAPGVDGSGSNRGAVYVFNRVGGVWSETQILTPGDPRDFHGFGVSIDIDGDYAIVGANNDDTNGFGSGAAYVFQRNGGTWAHDAKILPGDGVGQDKFGTDVAVDDSRILVSATGGDWFGKGYVYDHVGGNWMFQGQLQPDEPEEFDIFGWRVALQGDSAFIGAQSHDSNGVDVGAVFIFKGSNGWNETNVLYPGNGTGILNFGQALAVSGDRLVIGALDSQNGVGLAYTYRESRSRWTENARLEEFDQTFGQSLDLDTIAVGGGWAGNTACVFDADRLEAITFEFDPNLSALDIVIQFPGEDPQLFEVHMTGSMSAFVNMDCNQVSTLQIPEFELRPLEDNFDLELPDKSHLIISNVSFVPTLPGPPAELVRNGNQYDGILSDYAVEVRGQTGASPGKEDEPFAVAILDCVMTMFLSFSPVGGDEIVFPGIDFTADLDLSLGNLNPNMRVKGEIGGSTSGTSNVADLTDVAVTTGSLLDGELTDLQVSDDAYVHTRSGFGRTLVDLHNMTMIVNANTINQSAATLDLTIETRISHPTGTMQIRLRNWNSNAFDLVGTRVISDIDQVMTLNDIDSTNYVESGTGNIDLQIKQIVFVPQFAFLFESWIDWVEIAVQ